MSKKETAFCDRCGAEIDPAYIKEQSALIKLWQPNEYRSVGGQRIDLCEECYQKFVYFLERGD